MHPDILQWLGEKPKRSVYISSRKNGGLYVCVVSRPAPGVVLETKKMIAPVDVAREGAVDFVILGAIVDISNAERTATNGQG